MDSQAVEQAVRAILTNPDVDLATISSKRVRKELAETFGGQTVKDNKETIDAIIIEAFNQIATSAGATAPAAEAKAPEAVQPGSAVHVKQEDVKPMVVQPESNGHANVSAAKHDDPPPTTSEEEEEDDQGSDFSQDEEDRKPSSSKAKPKAKPKKPTQKAQPPKRKIMSSSSIHPSSPSVPLSMATGLTDEDYAKQLQAEFDLAEAGGRATRGGGYVKAATRNGKKKGASSKGAKGKKVQSNKYVNDSDLEDDEDMPKKSKKRQRDEDDDEAGESDEQAESKPKKRSGGGGGGGYQKELALSESLQKVCGTPTMSRPQIVKRLWEYIHANELQDPNRRSDIVNDELFKDIFGVDKMTMFSMNKLLKKSVSPIDG